MELMELRASRDPLEHQANWVMLDPQDNPDHQDSRVRTERRAREEIEGNPAKLAQQGHRVRMVSELMAGLADGFE